jgi:hypothetical protein
LVSAELARSRQEEEERERIAKEDDARRALDAAEARIQARREAQRMEAAEGAGLRTERRGGETGKRARPASGQTGSEAKKKLKMEKKETKRRAETKEVLKGLFANARRQGAGGEDVIDWEDALRDSAGTRSSTARFWLRTQVAEKGRPVTLSELEKGLEESSYFRGV